MSPKHSILARLEESIIDCPTQRASSRRCSEQRIQAVSAHTNHLALAHRSTLVRGANLIFNGRDRHVSSESSRNTGGISRYKNEGVVSTLRTHATYLHGGSGSEVEQGRNKIASPQLEKQSHVCELDLVRLGLEIRILCPLRDYRYTLFRVNEVSA